MSSLVPLVLGFFLLLLEDALEDLGHVLDEVENLAGDKNRALLLEGEDDGVARAGVEFKELAAQLVLHVENDAGEVGAVVDVVDDDALKADLEAQQEMAKEAGIRAGRIDDVANFLNQWGNE